MEGDGAAIPLFFWERPVPWSRRSLPSLPVPGAQRHRLLSQATRDGLAAPRSRFDTRAMHEPEDDEPVIIAIEDALDLHTFAPRDIPAAVEGYVEAAVEAGFREVRLIHGRGIGFQRRRVQEVLSRLAGVESFRDAPPERGGWGATIVLLRAGRS